MQSQWKIGSSVVAASKLILEREISVNWLVIQSTNPTLLDGYDDYELETTIENRDMDEFFRNQVASGTLKVPAPAIKTQHVNTVNEIVPLDPPTPNTAPAASPDVNVARPVVKIFVVVVDERGNSGEHIPTPRATTVFVYNLRQEEAEYFVRTRELIEQLQMSSESVVGSARLSLGVLLGGLFVRSSFYILREEAEVIGIPDVPELQVTAADRSTGCTHSLTIYLDTPGGYKAVKKEAVEGGSAKRHFSTLSTDSTEDDYRKETSKSDCSTPSIRATPAARATATERGAAQLRWLAGPSSYSNAISTAIQAQVKSKQGSATCALAIFCTYVYIVSNVRPGADCDSAGRTDITNKCLAEFLGVAPGWIAQAKAAGALQIVASHIPAVKAHLDGDIPDSYMGIGPWTQFLEAMIERHEREEKESHKEGLKV
ncbi:hypothetical protein K438DRAFT_2015879 [Mycena galopus ATCC 62051]|nr:hypothetical protein K438DRAFT_2015879 [Mycena galopus ATCC 62051]